MRRLCPRSRVCAVTVPGGERGDIMENSENKKTLEELADEVLDKVAGGKAMAISPGYCPKCNSYYMPSQARRRGGDEYYCPYHYDTVLQF